MSEKLGSKPYVHLHVHTEYSLLDGLAKISKLGPTCVERNFPAIAMTDHGNMYGAVKFVEALEGFNEKNKTNIKGIIGTEFYICNDLHVKSGREDTGHIILLAKTQEGLTNIIQLNSIAHVEGMYYKPRIDYKTLKEHSKGIVCLSGCLAGHVAQYLLQGMYDEAKKLALELKDMFEPGDFYIEVQNHNLSDQLRIIEKQFELAKEIGVKAVITNDAHYINRDEAELQDVMVCINTKRLLNDPDRFKMEGSEYYLKNYDELAELFPNHLDALDVTLEIAEKCNATMIFHQKLAPAFPIETGETPDEMLRRLVYEGLEYKYGKPLSKEITDRADYELGVIINMGFSDYFLIVADYVKWSEDHGIVVGPGRGSGAGSIVAYALGITKVEPLRYDLLFERFLNPARVSMPDIDLDFDFDRRTEVIDFVTEKYGRDRVCQIITFGTLAAKAAIKDVARVLNVPYAEINKLTKNFPDLKTVGKDPLRKIFGYEVSPENEKYIVPDLKKTFDENEQIRRVIKYAIRLEGMPRHTGMHAAGVLICRYKIMDYIPLNRNGNDITTQFYMNEIEKIGGLKMDFLGLKTLTDIKKACDLIEKLHGVKIDFYAPDFSYDDKEVFKYITSGNTDTVFQLESGGMKKFMKELKPDTLEDLIAGIAMYRPGPMSMIPKFVEGKHNPASIVYEHPRLEPILSTTYGCMVYQEQVMRIVQDLAGYDLAQADNVRKMMSKKKMDDLLAEREVFINGKKDPRHDIVGCVANGIPKEVAEDLFTKMEAFGSYAFNKSHSAVYAYIAYQTAYLKYYYENEWLCAVLNDRIDNIDEVKKYILIAKQRGFEILPPSINKSDVYFMPEGEKKIRYGLAALRNVGIKVVESVIKKRSEIGEFKDLDHLISNIDGLALNKRFIESIILSGALDEFNVKRSQMMNVYSEIIDRTVADRKNKQTGQFDFFSGFNDSEINVKTNYPNIPEFKDQVKLKYEKEVLGTYISGHPLDNHLNKFDNFTLTSSMLKPINDVEEETLGEDEEEKIEAVYDPAIENGKAVVCGGIITEVNKKVSKNSNREFAFVTIEDLEGTFDIMISGNKYENYKDRLETDVMLTVYGKISIRDEQTPIIMVDKLSFWSESDMVDEKPVEKVEVEKTQKLFLKFSTLDTMLQAEVFNILRGHGGNIPVVIKCSETGNVFKCSDKVDGSNGLLIELKAILGEENVVMR